MERHIRVNWSAVVEEARYRRKAEGLTQRRLAAIADISPPTVSRFEQGDRNLQLASALAILDVLDLLETPELTFTDSAARHDRDRDAVLFEGWNADNARVFCAVTGEALADQFEAQGARSRARLAAFRKNRRRIEQVACQKYAAGHTEPDGSILVRIGDVTEAKRAWNCDAPK